MKYFLEISILPSKHYIRVKGKIENPKSNKFYLNENFTILKASSQGENIGFYMSKDEPHPAFDTVSRPVIFEFSGEMFEFEYEGTISEIIADINQIDENIVELAYYAGWYPKPETLDTEFDFELNVDMPEGYQIASNGNCIGDNKICSSEKQMDIVFFASNEVSRVEYIEQNIKCVFLCPKDMVSSMEQRAKDLTAANILFTETFGAIETDNKITEILSVIRPRGGWGYKRGNASFVSAEWGKEAKQYKDDFHELAHGWWSIADMFRHDWINEGVAEFSAFVAAKSIYGNEFAEKYITGCIGAIEKSDCMISIVDTDSNSEYRQLNHYIKPTIMFIKAQQLFGEQKMLDCLKKLYQTFKNTQDATTDAFLELCEQGMSAFFKEYLFVEDWSKLNYNL